MRGSRGARVLVALVLAVTVATAASPTVWAWTTKYGHVGSADRTLRAGCHHYRYHYVVEPPDGDWMLETWLHDPRGRPRGSGDFAPGSDPRRGHASFGVCRSTVVPGRFTITARLSWWTPGALPTDPPVHHKRWFEPAHFWLR